MRPYGRRSLVAQRIHDEPRDRVQLPRAGYGSVAKNLGGGVLHDVETTGADREVNLRKGVLQVAQPVLRERPGLLRRVRRQEIRAGGRIGRAPASRKGVLEDPSR